MTTDARIVDLRGRVRAAQEEFDLVIKFHEAWKPAAFDTGLHQRLSASFAAHAFGTILEALQREMVMALMRVWDYTPGSVRLRELIENLADETLIDALVEDRMQTLSKQSNMGLQGFKGQLRDAIKEGADEASAVFISWTREGAEPGVRQRLQLLRNQVLAHRQVEVDPGNIGATSAEVEAFLQDTLTIVKRLGSVVLAEAYDPADTANVYREPSKLFWEGVRGERTLGHPSYREPFEPSAPK
jgi:hypothetical protein